MMLVAGTSSRITEYIVFCLYMICVHSWRSGSRIETHSSIGDANHCSAVRYLNVLVALHAVPLLPLYHSDKGSSGLPVNSTQIEDEENRSRQAVAGFHT
jgi:hypothetical protein